jgi:hypothetical protein
MNNSANVLSSQKVFLDETKTWLYYLANGRVMRLNATSSIKQEPEICVDYWCCGDYWYPPPVSPIMNFYIRDEWIYYTVIAAWGVDLNPLELTVILKTSVDCKGPSEFADSQLTDQSYDNGDAFYAPQVSTTLQ